VLCRKAIDQKLTYLDLQNRVCVNSAQGRAHCGITVRLTRTRSGGALGGRKAKKEEETVQPTRDTPAASFNRLMLAFGVGALWLGSVVIGQGPTSALPAREMAMKITEPFTLASVGALLILRPVSQWTDPSLQSVLKIIRDADIGFGNLESLISDIRNFDGPMRGWMGTKEVAADLKSMGFDLVNRANNHAWDSQHQGFFSTHSHLDEIGIGYAGAGKNLEDARAATFLETPKGRVGLIGMHTLNGRTDDPPGATERLGNAGGRPGVNAIDLARSLIVTADQLAALRKIRDSIYERRSEFPEPVVRLPTNEPPDRMQLFSGTNGVGAATIGFKIGDRPGDVSYTMNAEHLRANLRSIRNGKHYSDFMIATIHAHQSNNVLQSYGDRPPDFLVELARKSIENGADAFVGHGVHVLRGIEIYRGKPIFYGMGEFVTQMHWAPTDSNAYRGRKLDPLTTETTEAQMADRRESTATGTAIDYESMVALSRFDRGQLVEIRLFPIELRYDGPFSRWGVPRMAPPDMGRRILTRVQALSKELGTTVTIEGNTGVIRVPPSVTTSSGDSRP
jgi:poly-gamma-glutamate capsule biosynthesis protein CapA/YwtB (metallophosphatase superfamily)